MTTEATDALIGAKVLGIYTIRKRIGEGGMGTVYRAEPDTGHPIAVKVMNPDQCSPEMLARFRAEATILNSVRHDNVVKLVGIDTLPDGRTFMALEFLDGKTLAEHMASWGPLTTDDAFPIVLQLCAGLQAAHGAGVLHRDLKPENVIICRDGKVKILDFGIAKTLAPVDPTAPREKLTKTGMVLGTRSYMAPEQAEGRKVGLVADVFALGVIVFELLTGRQPFNTDTEGGDDDPTSRLISLIHYYVKVDQGAAPRPSLGAVAAETNRTDITPGWVRAVDAALDVRPESRTQTVRMFAEPIISDSPWGAALVSALAPTLLERGSAMDRTIPARADSALPFVASQLRDARITEIGNDTFTGHPERARAGTTLAQSAGQVAPRAPRRGRGPLVAALAGAAVVVGAVVAVVLLSGDESDRDRTTTAAPAPVAPVEAQPAPAPPVAAEPPVAVEPPPAVVAAPPTAAQVPGAGPADFAPPVAQPAAPTAAPPPSAGTASPRPTKKARRKPPTTTTPTGSRDPDGLDI